jgi:hypothetical protein
MKNVKWMLQLPRSLFRTYKYISIFLLSKLLNHYLLGLQLLNIGACFSLFLFRGTVALSIISIILNLISVAPLVQIVRSKLYSVLHRQTDGWISK